MLILDDILLFPVRSMGWILQQIHDAAQQELATEAESITSELRELYMMLETGQITEADFDACEKELLDRLDEMQKRENSLQEQDEEEEVLEGVDGIRETA